MIPFHVVALLCSVTIRLFSVTSIITSFLNHSYPSKPVAQIDHRPQHSSATHSAHRSLCLQVTSTEKLPTLTTKTLTSGTAHRRRHVYISHRNFSRPCPQAICSRTHQFGGERGNHGSHCPQALLPTIHIAHRHFYPHGPQSFHTVVATNFAVKMATIA